tara:strand:- start:324 stop:518 length:195 start_codon:yes stop_codon:yes gene_type:complete
MSDYNHFEKKPIEKVKNDIHEINKNINKLKLDLIKINADISIIKDFIIEKKKENDDISSGWFWN